MYQSQRQVYYPKLIGTYKEENVTLFKNCLKRKDNTYK